MTTTEKTTAAFRLRPGHPYPLGATWDGKGTNFALYSENATRVELCLFDDQGNETRHELPEQTAFVWHGYLPGVGPGQRYGYRVHGEYAPEARPALQPERGAARSLCQGAGRYRAVRQGRVRLRAGRRRTRSCKPRSSAARRWASWSTRCFNWVGDEKPNMPFHRSVIYEAHVKGLTMTHPDVPEALRGTYAGVATEPVIATCASWASRPSSFCRCTSTWTIPSCSTRG